jgi:hypothetical protein
LHYEHNGQQTTNNNKTASTDGNNSPAITGNNNALIQNSPGATLNYGLSDDTYKHIREVTLPPKTVPLVNRGLAC